MTRAQFIASICAIPFIGKLFKVKRSPTDIRFYDHALTQEEVSKIYYNEPTVIPYNNTTFTISGDDNGERFVRVTYDGGKTWHDIYVPFGTRG